MKVLVTGSAGHLGEALVRTSTDMGYEVVGIDVSPSPFTTHVGTITDRQFVKKCLKGITQVFHTATLHKPHVATHSEQEFVDTNISGTLNLLQQSVAAGVGCFIYTSTTSVFGDALVPPPTEPAAWITEAVVPTPKNIYGVTKAAAEDLCQLYHRNHGLPCLVLRTSRFFPEEDDSRKMREAFADENLKANEFLFRRVEIGDVVSAHIAAAAKAQEIGFGKYIISASSPFTQGDLAELRSNAPAVVARLFPGYMDVYNRFGWKMLPGIDRVYVNELARQQLGWEPVYDFAHVLTRLQAGEGLTSPVAKLIGSKGYHEETFADGPYPVK